jgi:excisionase family DNA binding protein
MMKISAEFEVEDSAFWQMMTRGVPRGHWLPTAAPPQKTVAEDQPTNDRWMRVNEGAKYASVSRSLLYKACASGRLRHARVGESGTIRLRKAWIDDWMTRSETLASGV